MSKIDQHLMSILGMAVTLFGLYVIIGWLIANPAMVTIIPGSPTIVFNTAICFVACGMWLTVRPTLDINANRPSLPWFMSVLTFIIFIISTTVLIEIIFDLDLKIDWASLHKLVPDRNPNPGRMAPNSCIAFLFIVISFSADWVKNIRSRRIILVTGGLITFLLGLSSLLGYSLQLDWLYSFLQFNRMAFTTAVALTLIGFTLALVGQSTAYEVHSDKKNEDLRITRIAVVILTVLSLASGITGFLVIKRGTDESLQNDFKRRIVNSADYVTTTLDKQYLLMDQLLSYPVITKDLETLPLHPKDTNSVEHLNKVGAILLNLGFSSLQIKNTAGEATFTMGVPSLHPNLSQPIKIGSHDAQLLWDKSFILQIDKPIFKDGFLIGSVITEQKLNSLDTLFNHMQFSGHTTDSGLCRRDGDSFICFPSRFISYVFHGPMFNNGRLAYPMSHALNGETGVIYANDIRGVPVLAAFAPVGNTGLGIVLKTETTEIYKFIRDRLHILMGILALFVLAGAYILHIRFRPLVTRIVHSEQRMRKAKEVLEKDADRLNQIIAIQNEVASAPLDLSNTLKIVVEQVQYLTNSAGAVIELIDGDELLYRMASGTFVPFTGYRLKIEGSLSGHSIHTGTTIYCEDTETDPRTDKLATRKLDIRSMIVAPLQNEGTVIGVLKTASSTIKAFTPQDEQALQLLSGLIGSAISHHRDYEEKQRLLGERTEALTKLEKITDTLRVSEERTRIIIESAYDAFIAFNHKGEITDWNKQAELILGWPKEEALGKKLDNLIMPSTSLASFHKQLELLLAENYKPERNQRLELAVQKRSGDYFDVEMTINPIRSGQSIMFAAFLHDITERTKARQKLTYLAQFDALTELPNRSLFMDRLSAALLRADRSKKGMALLYLDLDGFKKINDHYGHHVGDILLKEFAQRLSKVVRKTDTVSRLAGDEFTIILEELDQSESNAVSIANKIIQSMSVPFILAGEVVNITTSIGITLGNSEINNIDDLIKFADMEMYKAKNKGKNQYSLGRNLGVYT